MKRKQGDGFALETRWLEDRLVARFTVDDTRVVEMEAALQDGVLVLGQIRVERLSGPPLTGQELRAIPIREWLRIAMNGAKPELTPARRHAVITDDFLRDVARVYRTHAHLAPVEAVLDALGPAGHSTAARWIKLARDRGFLPRTTPGKVAT